MSNCPCSGSKLSVEILAPDLEYASTREREVVGPVLRANGDFSFVRLPRVTFVLNKAEW